MTRRRHILIYILTAVSLLLPSAASAQQYGIHRHQRTAEEQAIEDSIPLFRGVTIGVDAVGAATRIFSDYGQYEAFARVNLKDRYFPTLEFGYGSADHTDDVTNIHYKADAPYGRIGVDFNVMKNKHDNYLILVGVRYGYTSFKYDAGPVQVLDPVWREDATWEAHDQDCTYGWIEGVAGVDATIWKFVHLGWNLRYRSRLHQKYGDAGEPWYVPGYGKRGKSRLAVEFNISFAL